MSPKNPVKAANKPVVNPNKSTKASKTGWAVNTGIIVSNVLVEVAQCASVLGLQHAAMAVSAVMVTIERVQSNKEDFKIIANDASELIIAIWRLQEKSENPKEWISPEIRDTVADLKKTLDEVDKFANRQARRSALARIVFNMTDAGKIRQSREKINTAVARFQVLSHIKINELLHEFSAVQQELSQGIKDIQANNAQVRDEGDEEEEEDDDDEDDDDDEEDEEDEEGSAPSTSRETTRPTPLVAPNSAAIHGFSFSNSGSGKMYNRNVGNIVNANISNIGNNYSKNYIYG